MTRVADRALSSVGAVTPAERLLEITVLSGGPSTEREVSLKSGRAVASALVSLGHEVRCTDIAPGALEALDWPADVVFIALHGRFGEDGQVQRILEERGIRYTGSGPEASALAMDKVATKRRFIEAEIPTPRFDVVTPDRFEVVLRSWRPPVVVKPVAEGSSVDCVIAHDSQAFRSALGRVLSKYGQGLIEHFIKGPELTVGILGEVALPAIEIRTRREFYNYQAKYLDDDTQYRFDIDLPEAVVDEVRRLSLQAHRALGCRDFSRVDWMVDGVTHQPYALEINTIPGFTDHSLLPKAAQRAGLRFADLCAQIVEMALHSRADG